MGKLGYGFAAAAVLAWGCHTITEELPTQPTGTPPAGTGVLTVPIPAIPGATPTPTPRPTPTPTPTPGPSPSPTPTPGTGGCGQPLPPPVTQMGVKIHIRGVNRYTLDSTPLVGPDAAYCRQIGFTDGRSYCPVRAEGAPDRSACETYAIGYADDTHRPGPTWYFNDDNCKLPSCENHEENQYLAYAYASGRYQACTKDGVCGSVDVVR
jgi:hypothetical protein